MLADLGLGYLSLDRTTTTLSPGELQRLRLATQLRSGLFGVVYVLDEPSAGLHPADAEPLMTVLDQLKAAGNSLFVVEHDMDVVRRADWVVDVGPGAGEQGGHVLYSGPVDGLEDVDESVTGAVPVRSGHRARSRAARAVGVAVPAPRHAAQPRRRRRRVPARRPDRGDRRVGVGQVDARHPGARAASWRTGSATSRGAPRTTPTSTIEDRAEGAAAGVHALGLEAFDRLVSVDQKPIGRTPRSNLATYTGMFDAVRKLFASTDEAQRRGYAPGRFSFNVARRAAARRAAARGSSRSSCCSCPGTYAPCPTCHGARYEPETLEIRVRGKSIADVLGMTVDEAAGFLADVPAAMRSLETLREVGLGYLRLGQPATELSGGEAQRIKLATELQRGRRGHALYLLDEPTTGLHPSDVELLLRQLHRLVDAGNTVVVVEHHLDVIAGADWIIDLGPGAGDEGGTIVATGPPEEVARSERSRTAPYLAERLRPRRARTAAAR